MPPKKKDEVDSRITKRRVTMQNAVMTPDGPATLEAVDFVRPDFLDVYVADARTRWQLVTVSEEPDAGPGGYEGDTVIPEHLIGKTVNDIARYGDASTPENAMDEFHGTQAGGALNIVGGNS